VPSWIDLSGVNLSAFGLPKDFDIKKKLLWTTQTDALWQKLKVEPLGNTFRGQILAGPSGIGKSHIALPLALRCYAACSPVLYVGNAGEYLTTVNRVGSVDDNLRVDKALLRDFAAERGPCTCGGDVQHYVHHALHAAAAQQQGGRRLG
jgi:hypothetical protein